MKNLIAGGFLFIGGTILMLVTKFDWAPVAGLVCALIGVGMLLYYVFSKDGKY